MKLDKTYCYGVLLTVLGGEGLAENVTSGRGSFIICSILFSIGLGMVLYGYMK